MWARFIEMEISNSENGSGGKVQDKSFKGCKKDIQILTFRDFIYHFHFQSSDGKRGMLSYDTYVQGKSSHPVVLFIDSFYGFLNFEKISWDLREVVKYIDNIPLSWYKDKSNVNITKACESYTILHNYLSSKLDSVKKM